MKNDKILIILMEYKNLGFLRFNETQYFCLAFLKRHGAERRPRANWKQPSFSSKPARKRRAKRAGNDFERINLKYLINLYNFSDKS